MTSWPAAPWRPPMRSVCAFLFSFSLVFFIFLVLLFPSALLAHPSLPPVPKPSSILVPSSSCKLLSDFLHYERFVRVVLVSLPPSVPIQYMAGSSEMSSSSEALIRPTMTQSWLDTVRKCPGLVDDSSILGSPGVLHDSAILSNSAMQHSIYDVNDYGTRPESPLRFDHEEILSIETDVGASLLSSSAQCVDAVADMHVIPPSFVLPFGLQLFICVVCCNPSSQFKKFMAKSAPALRVLCWFFSTHPS